MSMMRDEVAVKEYGTVRFLLPAALSNLSASSEALPVANLESPDCPDVWQSAAGIYSAGITATTSESVTTLALQDTTLGPRGYIRPRFWLPGNDLSLDTFQLVPKGLPGIDHGVSPATATSEKIVVKREWSATFDAPAAPASGLPIVTGPGSLTIRMILDRATAFDVFTSANLQDVKTVAAGPGVVYVDLDASGINYLDSFDINILKPDSSRFGIEEIDVIIESGEYISGRWMPVSGSAPNVNTVPSGIRSILYPLTDAEASSVETATTIGVEIRDPDSYFLGLPYQARSVLAGSHIGDSGSGGWLAGQPDRAFTGKDLTLKHGHAGPSFTTVGVPLEKWTLDLAADGVPGYEALDVLRRYRHSLAVGLWPGGPEPGLTTIVGRVARSGNLSTQETTDPAMASLKGLELLQI